MASCRPGQEIQASIEVQAQSSSFIYSAQNLHQAPLYNVAGVLFLHPLPAVLHWWRDTTPPPSGHLPIAVHTDSLLGTLPTSFVSRLYRFATDLQVTVSLFWMKLVKAQYSKQPPLLARHTEECLVTKRLLNQHSCNWETTCGQDIASPSVHIWLCKVELWCSLCYTHLGRSRENENNQTGERTWAKASPLLLGQRKAGEEA